MPFSYEQIEYEIVTRLSTVLANYAVTIPLPDAQKDIDDNIKLAESNNKAFIGIIYSESNFDTSSSTNYARQTDSMQIVCNLRRSKRRGSTGIMNMLQLVKLSLQGYQPQNATRLFLKSIVLDDRDYEKATWSYNLTFTCSKLQVQNFVDGDDLEGAILTQVKWNEESVNEENISLLGDFSNDYSEDFNTGIQ